TRLTAISDYANRRYVYCSSCFSERYHFLAKPYAAVESGHRRGDSLHRQANDLLTSHSRPPPMRRLSLHRQRQIFIWGFFVLLSGGGWGVGSRGLRVIWGPSAGASDIAGGRELFEHEWAPNDPLAHGDGLGPVYNARSCATCHFQGGLGGGGEVAHNATSYEVHSRPGDDEFHTGTLHAFSVTPAHRESMAVLKGVSPTIPGPTIRDPNCPSMTFPDFDPVRTEKVQPTALYGSGWIDLMSDKAIRHNQRSRQL